MTLQTGQNTQTRIEKIKNNGTTFFTFSHQIRLRLPYILF